ncbi:hypothetical protein [Zoogloea sp.]|uniref:hypothetical protein n=1 Tax=Zoogloea sp. TaxID=49181 RepID=UPI001AC8EF7E|nr:hypothetical protein [Zoogloea sp.]MBN8283087.1 hypothetical protein [Zoogloea sp.]
MRTRNQCRTIAARYTVGEWCSDDGVSAKVTATQWTGLEVLLAKVREGDVFWWRRLIGSG